MKYFTYIHNICFLIMLVLLWNQTVFSESTLFLIKMILTVHFIEQLFSDYFKSKE